VLSHFNTSSMVTLLFLLLVAGIFTWMLIGLRRVLVRTGWKPERQQAVFFRALAALVAWAMILAGLALAGFFANFAALPPRIPLSMVVPLVVMAVLVFSRGGTTLLQVMPPHWPLYAQTIRIGVELVILVAVLNRLMPIQLSIEGRNFDIVTGLLAVPVGYYVFVVRRWPRWVAVVYHLMGMGLLVNVLALSFLSMPTPMRVFFNEPANTLITQFPFIYLPGMLVPLAFSLHIVSLRQMAVLRRGGYWKVAPPSILR
jgi:hypothetical protein